MSSQVICDLCGKPITNNDVEQLKYRIKKRWWLWEESGWHYIDVHESCRKKLFDIIENYTSPDTENSEQKD